MTIGVLGLQGDIEENVAATSQALQELHINGSVDIVRYPEELEKIDGLILPGGESTVQSTLAAIQRSLPVIKKRISEGMPVLGICAGMIMLSKRAYDRIVGDTKQKLIGNLDIVTERNAFGRQNESFEADLSLGMLGKEAFKGVFIRAPAVSEVGKDVEVIGKLNNRIVAVKQKNIIGTAFHPELSGDSRIHKHLINMVLEFKNKNGS
ncbi:MAG: pyridoxal 5'-phosphate synthase glutaminase subunit PdxT [Thermoproteota archaeon]|nr:pyridoxal 5'-phosphate synthase glutaminase subunit PdxT [Thermoproteota archaeon]